MKCMSERESYMRGFADGSSRERRLLYTTIDVLLVKAAHSEDFDAARYRVIEETLLDVQKYFRKETK